MHAGFCALRPLAEVYFRQEKLTLKDAWAKALNRARNSRAKSFQDVNLEAIGHVLIRHACYGVSTAGVEQLFSKHKRFFGNHRLSGSESYEVLGSKKNI